MRDECIETSWRAQTNVSGKVQDQDIKKITLRVLNLWNSLAQKAKDTQYSRLMYYFWTSRKSRIKGEIMQQSGWDITSLVIPLDNSILRG